MMSQLLLQLELSQLPHTFLSLVIHNSATQISKDLSMSIVPPTHCSAKDYSTATPSIHMKHSLPYLNNLDHSLLISTAKTETSSLTHYSILLCSHLAQTLTPPALLDSPHYMHRGSCTGETETSTHYLLTGMRREQEEARRLGERALAGHAPCPGCVTCQNDE